MGNPVPAKRLRSDTTEKVPKFAVVGNYGANEEPLFVTHVAILREEAELRCAGEAIVWQMKPPLVTGPLSEAVARHDDSRATVHLVGIVHLTAQDVEGIATWLAEVDKEIRPFGVLGTLRQYIVDPPVDWAKAENGVRLYRRFSCAGFVMECYRAADINLIDDANAGNLPEVDLEIIARAYGDNMRRDKMRERFGIPGNGPWRIVLAGYVMHALHRQDHEIRVSPHVPANVAEKDYPLPGSISPTITAPP